MFRLPTRVVLEPGALRHLSTLTARKPWRRLLLVTDAGLQHTPWPMRVRELLRGQRCTTVVFDGVEPNPRHTTVDALAEKARTEKVDAIIGLGGGSVLDAAKAAALLATNDGPCVAYEGRNRATKASLPFIAIPTTCGTGSEVTWVAVVTHTQQERKMSIKGDALFPTLALVDADVLTSLPPPLVASTGLDALTHAVEATTGQAANPVSDALAEKATALLLTYLPRAVDDIAGDAEARAAVMHASTLAGIAFGNADVGGVHCLSETIGGIWDVPHGLTNALLLVPVLRYHHRHIAPRLAELDAVVERRATGHATHFVDRLEHLVSDLPLPPFASLGIPTDAYLRIAEGAVANTSNASNPQPMTAADYLAILRGLDTSA